MSLGKLNFIFFVGVFILSYAPFILLSRIVNFSTWIEILVIVIAGSILFLILATERDSLFDCVLSHEQKERMGFFIVRWKSEEFDKFVGEELLDLHEDNRALLQSYNPSNDKSVDIVDYSDYSFLVLPIAKVYEGILKKILVDGGLLKEDDLFKNPSINVGGYYNPVGNNKIFKLLKDKARDKAVPHVIYSTYQECRNQILHYDQYRDNRIKSYEDAEFYCRRIIYAIEKAYETFKK